MKKVFAVHIFKAANLVPSFETMEIDLFKACEFIVYQLVKYKAEIIESFAPLG